MNKWRWNVAWWLTVLTLAFGLAACNEDPVDGDDDVGLTDDDDDDDNDDNDDNNDDNDDNDNDNDDNDTTPPDPDTEYDSLYCPTADPETIGEGLLIGGGPITDAVTVYVFSDKDCLPLESATVLAGGQTYTTDADGKAVITVSKAPLRVTAYLSGFEAWTYEADAAVMYFRLRPGAYGYTYNNSLLGRFQSGGAELQLFNPAVAGIGELGELLTNPVYAGLTIPGASRQTLLNIDLDGVLTTINWRIDIDLPDAAYYLLLPHNIYFPQFLVDNLFGFYWTMPDHSFYQFPQLSGATENPMEAFIVNLSLGNVLDLPTLTQIIIDLLGGGDITEIILTVLQPLLEDGLVVDYVGADPVWDGTGAPNLEVAQVDPAKAEIAIDITDPDPEGDYLGIMAAEIPNRAVLPLDLGLADAGTMTLSNLDVTDADYLLLLAKTNFIATAFESSDFSFALRYAALVDEWDAGVTLADTDFLPYFDAVNTVFDPVAGTIDWALASRATADAYFVFYFPQCESCASVMACLPGTATSYEIAEDLGITPAEEDIVVLLAVDLPDGVDVDEYNPIAFLGYNNAAISMWMNYNVIDLITLLFNLEPKV